MMEDFNIMKGICAEKMLSTKDDTKTLDEILIDLMLYPKMKTRETFTENTKRLEDYFGQTNSVE